MSAIFIILTLLQIATCGSLIVLILLQKKRTSGLSGAVSGMASGGGTYWDKNKGRSFEGQLEKYTKIGGIVFFALSFLLSFVR